MLDKNNNIVNYKPEIFFKDITDIAMMRYSTIILPEGYDTRIIEAASFCEKNKISHCILLGEYKKIIEIAKKNNIDFCYNIEVIDIKNISENFIDELIKINSKKNPKFSRNEAVQFLQDELIVALMMLRNNIAHGVVCGARTTTAHVLRNSFRIIGMEDGVKLVSSFFIVCIDDRVMFFSDCAININPSIDNLVEIARATIKSAKNLNFFPIVSMLSYSTGKSGIGSEVEKVFNATNEIKLSGDNSFIVEGPMQYDAAVSKKTRDLKLPNNLFGDNNANVLIFPDLTSGNITVKAVQHACGSISIGPILQGLNKPVNDLSRGCTVKDIIFTIIMTSIQNKNKIIYNK